MASSEGGGVTDLFGKCQNYGHKRAKNIARFNDFASVLSVYILEIETESNETFSNEIAKISEIHQETQDKL